MFKLSSKSKLYFLLKCKHQTDRIGHYLSFCVYLLTETEHVTPEQTDEGKTLPDDGIKPLETKALNFLVNQYLLQINNKLTSVTFSEENEEQVPS